MERADASDLLAFLAVAPVPCPPIQAACSGEAGAAFAVRNRR